MTRQGVRDLGSSSTARREESRKLYDTETIRSPSPSVLASDRRPRVAVDVCVSNKEISELESAGFCVAVVAEEGETDAGWLTRAAALAVDIVCSPDKEVWTWAIDCGLILIKLDNSNKSEVVDRVHAAWQSRVRQ